MIKKSLLAILAALSGACTTTSKLPPLEKVPAVDLERFMGDWYVIANIPTFVEKGAHNAIEHYDRAKDGSIDITFTFRKDGFDGDHKKYTMTGTPVDGTNNAEWTVSPFWPIKLPYYTVELPSDYSWVVVATPNRGYLWIMARKPSMEEGLLKSIIARMVERGFKEAEIQIVPQKW
jgi:apolipoprotein D and lipocalin family protein